MLLKNIIKEQLHFFLSESYEMKNNKNSDDSQPELVHIDEQIVRRVLYKYLDEKADKKFKKKRKYGQSYCKSTPCSKMGFSQKASCRPYKNCYK